MNVTDPDFKNVFNLELYFELSHDLLCIAGYDGYFKQINPTVSKTLGYTTEELYSKKISEFIHPDDRDLTARNRENLTNNNPLLNFENRYVTKTGETVWLSWTSIPIHNEGIVFAIAKNITHKIKLEQDRNSHIFNLTKLNHDLKQLTYTTSHDLRSPVNNLLSLFNLFDSSKAEDAEMIEFIKMLRIAAEDLKQTLDTYVDALTQRDNVNILADKVSLQQCLDVVLNSLKSIIKDSRTNINVDFSAFDTVTFNKAYLESVFLNLITNSIKYTRPHINPIVFIYCEIDDYGNKKLIFRDEGQGFDLEKVKDKIFGFNQRFHNHNDSKGIGLYLVHNHVTSLGGTISIQSAPNKGATFTISFK